MRFLPAILMIFLAFFIIWGGAFFAPYQFDDFITPLQDPASQSLTNWIHELPRTLRPLTKFTYALESSLGLTEAYQRRIFSFFLALATLLGIFRLLWKKNHDIILSASLTLLWCSLPVHAETIISLAGRSTLLATFFIVLSLQSSKTWQKILFAFLAVLSKEVALLFFLYVLFTSKRKLLITLCLLSILIFNKKLISLIQYSWSEVPYIIPWWEGPAAISAGLTYILLPFKVSLDPEFPLMASALWFFVTLILVGLIIRYRNPVLILWLVLILPTQSLIPKLDPLSLRPLSFSMICLPLLMAGLWRNWRHKIYFLVVPLMIVSSIRSHQFARLYNDPVDLWKDASEKTEKKTRPLVNLSYFLVQKDKYHEAIMALEEAVRRQPDDYIIKTRLDSLRRVYQKD